MVLWDGREARSARSAKERRLFDDALSFKIRTGLTVRIPSSQNQFAAFTLAVDDRSLGLDRFIETSQDMLKMVGLTYHAHVSRQDRTHVRRRRDGEPTNTARAAVSRMDL